MQAIASTESGAYSAHAALILETAVYEYAHRNHDATNASEMSTN